MKDLLLAIDQGTTSTRSILHGPDLAPLATAQRPLAQHFPAPGWVEHEPEEIWSATLATMRDALAKGGADAKSLAGIGITNQRETTLLWDRASGRAIHRAIVWQDRRAAAHCARLAAEGAGGLIAERSGLLPDPYFSATKLAWLLDNVGGARAAAERGDLAFGTVDSFLLWRLTGGRVHATDATNAARTMLFDIRRGCWDADLLKLFNIPEAVLPQVRDNACEFGSTEPGLLGVAVPVRGMAGDQHAAMLGQACFVPGMVKSTYGTGCFLLINTGEEAVPSKNRLLTTLAWQLGGRRTYALEGAIFIAGAAVQWLRDGLGIIKDAAESGALAARADPAQPVYFVPAFTGLGAPHWDAEARGAILGLTRNTGPAEICRAALEAVAFQTRDLVEAMRADWGSRDDTALREAAATTTLQDRGSKTTLRGSESMTTLRVDGGMTASDYAMQALADLLGAPVDRPEVQETTALGAAYLAGLQAGLLPPPGPAVAHWRLDRRFQPSMPRAEADRRHAGWQDAVRRVLTR